MQVNILSLFLSFSGEHFEHCSDQCCFSFRLDLLSCLELKLVGDLIDGLPNRGANSASDHLLRINCPSLLPPVLATLLFDRVKVMAAVGNLGVQQLRQLACDRLVLLDSPLQHRARSTVACGNEEVDLLAGAGEAGGSGGKLLGDVPHTIRKLIPVKSLHGSE